MGGMVSVVAGVGEIQDKGLTHTLKSTMVYSLHVLFSCA